MLPLAGQMAGLNGLTFFVDTHGWTGGVSGQKQIRNFKKNFFFLFSKFFFYGQLRALQIVD